VLSLFPTAALAADTPAEALGEVDIYSGGFPMSYLSVNGIVQKQEYTYFLFRSDDTGELKEIPAYCINPNQYGVPQTVAKGESIKYLATEAATDPKIVGLVAAMYPHRSLEALHLDNKEQAFYAGKIALWCHLISGWDISRVTVNPALTGSEREIAQRILAAAQDIYSRGMSWSKVEKAQITAVPDQDTAYPVTVDGTAYHQQVFTVTSATWPDQPAIDIAFAAGSDIPAGTRIVDMDNKDITAVPVTYTNGIYEGQCKVLYPVDSVAGKSGSVQLSLSSRVFQSVVFYAICQETGKYGNLQRYLCDTDPITSVAASAVSSYAGEGETPPPTPTPTPTPTPGETPDIPVTPGPTPTPEPEPGELEILKYEQGTETPLAGASFEVKGPKGDVVGVFTTDSSGTVTVPAAEPGSYTVREVDPPEYHLLDDEPTKTVTVKSGETATLTFHNAPYGDLRVEKVDAATGGGLAGARIQIKHIESGAVYTQETQPGGGAFFTQLHPGAYEIRELAAPEGWQLDSQTYTVMIVAGECVGYTLKNEALPGLKITKYDSQTHTAMSRVTFEIFRDATSIGRYETDAMGEILLTGLQPGTYRVVEVDTGSTAHLIAPPQEVELTAGGGIRELVFFNDSKPGIWLVKVDSANPSKAIPNAVFTIRAVDGSFGPKEFTTDRNGEIDLSELPTGAYEVVEKSCEGYIIDQEQRIIHLEANQTARFVFTNTIKPSLNLIKLSSDGTRLAGVSFRIAKIEDGSRYLDRTTNAQGEILISGLEPGVYSVKETATLNDHILDVREYHVELFPGKTSTLVVENQKRANLTIRKTDKDTGAPVPGVTFTLNWNDGPTITTEPTGADGTVTLHNLLPGVYTITEQNVPEGYILDTTPQQVTLLPNRNACVQFQNFMRPTLKIAKIDINGRPLTGAIFEVKTKAGVKIGDFPVGADGTVTVSNVHLTEGYYIITEKQAPTGYILDPTPHEVYLRPGKTTQVSIENEKKPGLTIRKIDSVVGDGVEGAKFEIWVSKDQSQNGTYQKLDSSYYYTDENGLIELENLDTGWYKIVEVEPPAGFMLKDPSEQVIYVEHDKAVEVTFENIPKSALVIRKIDAQTGAPLVNA